MKQGLIPGQNGSYLIVERIAGIRLERRYNLGTSACGGSQCGRRAPHVAIGRGAQHSAGGGPDTDRPLGLERVRHLLCGSSLDIGQGMGVYKATSLLIQVGLQ